MSIEHNIENEVLEKIRAGKIAKRPRLFFVAQVALVAVLAIVALALSIFALSFIIFSIHESGEQFLLGFGGRGLLTLITLFPWFTVTLVVVLLFALEWLLRYFKFGYRIPVLRIFAGIVGVAIAGGIVLAVTPLHPFLLDRADHDQLPLIGPAYEGVRTPHEEQGVIRGDVTSIATSSFVCAHDDQDRDTDDGTWEVIPPPGFNLNSLSIGERVYVAGQVQGGVVQAYGIQPF